MSHLTIKSCPLFVSVCVLLAALSVCVGCASYSVSTTAVPLPVDQVPEQSELKFRISDKQFKTLPVNGQAVKVYPTLFDDDEHAVPVVVELTHEDVATSELVSTYNDIAELTLSILPEIRPDTRQYKVDLFWPLSESFTSHSAEFEVNMTRVKSMFPWGWAIRFLGNTPTKHSGSGSSSNAQTQIELLSVVYVVADALVGLLPEQRAGFTDPTRLAAIALSVSAEKLALGNIAIRRINDQQQLLRIALNATSKEMRIVATERLNDEMQIQLMEQTTDWEFRREIFEKLNRSQLERLSTSASDPAVGLAAQVRLGRRTWEEMFAERARTGEGLGDALGAAALVDDPKPTSATIVAACHTFIRRGDESRIPELRHLLLNYGDKPLAEDYLNCGRTELADAGREWARRHGYNIRSGIGSARVQWGSHK